MNVLEDEMSYRSGDVQCELEQREREKSPVKQPTARRSGRGGGWGGGGVGPVYRALGQVSFFGSSK